MERILGRGICGLVWVVICAALSAQAPPGEATAAPEHIVVLSDSTARVDQGNGPHYGPDHRSNLWPNALLALLTKNSGQRVGGTGILAIEGNAAGYDTDLWTIAGPYQFNERIGPFQEAIGVGGRIPANGATVTLGYGGTATLARLHGKTLWIYWAACADSKPFTVSVDGQAQGSFGDAPVAQCSSRRTQVFSGASGEHAVTITAPEGKVFLYGAEWSEDVGGVVVDNLAVGGATTGFYSSPAKLAYLRLIPNVKLVIVALGINDYAHELAPAAYRVNLEEIVRGMREGHPGVQGLIVNQYPIFADGRRNTVGDTQGTYWELAQAVAKKEGLPLLSLAEIWGSFPSIKERGYLTSDLVHPSDQGGQQIAAAIAREIEARHLMGTRH